MGGRKSIFKKMDKYMKKKLFAVSFLMLSLCVGLHAQSLGDTQFRQYVALTKKSSANPPGMTVYADYKYRILYIAMPVALNKSSVTPQVIRTMRDAMLAEMRKQQADLKVIRDLKISIVYTFITSDRDIFNISLSYRDF